MNSHSVLPIFVEHDSILFIEGYMSKDWIADLRKIGELRDMGLLTESEFQRISSSLAISPYEHDFNEDKVAEKVWDFDQWYREKR